MKKIVTLFLFLSCFVTNLYSQEIKEEEGQKIMEQLRQKMQAEEQAKQKAIEEAEKARIAAQKAEEEAGKKLVEKMRREMNESLEEKVFRSENNPEARKEAIEAALKTGKDRMVFVRMEEEEIVKMEKGLGIEADKNREFLGQKFDEVQEKYKASNTGVEVLLLENKKLKEYLARLDQMERKLKTGK